MYGDVVLGMKPENKEDIDPFEDVMDKLKEEKGVKEDLDLDVDDLKELVVRFKKLIKDRLGMDFPTPTPGLFQHSITERHVLTFGLLLKVPGCTQPTDSATNNSYMLSRQSAASLF